MVALCNWRETSMTTRRSSVKYESFEGSGVTINIASLSGSKASGINKVSEMGLQKVEDPVPPSYSPHKEIRKPVPRKIKILTIIAIYYGSIFTGCGFNTYGAVLTSLQTKYETDAATISKVFTILTGCYLVGALTAGVMFNYVNRQLSVISILSVMAAMAFLTPHCPSLATFFMSAALNGLCIGACDTAWFVWVMEMMQMDCPPYVQAQHFFYGLGVTFSGLVMAPFVNEKEEGADDVNLTLNSTLIDLIDSSSADEDKLFIPYTIVGMLMTAGALLHAFIFLFYRYHAPPPEAMEAGKEVRRRSCHVKSIVSMPPSEKPFIGNWSFPKLRMVLLSCCFLGAYQGMEVCTFQFFSKFAQNSDLHLPESKAAYVLTGMTASYAAGRGLAFIAVFKVPLLAIICVNIALMFIADILLVGWAIRSLPVLWASSILFGFGFSSLFASYCAYAERYLYFTNFIGSMMLVCGSGMAAIYPLVVGSFIEENPVILSYTSFFSIFIMILSVGSVTYLTHKDKTRY